MEQIISGRYREQAVAAADPLELVRMLYRGGIEAAREARRQQEAGRIAERTRAVNHLLEILNELVASLDLERGGEVARQLMSLYDYISWRTIEGNAQQKAEAFGEIERLLGVLLAGWEECRDAAAAPTLQQTAAAASPDPNYEPLSLSA
jgi:flagellar protein FliS